MKKYQIIYADPPWSYKDKRANDKAFASAESHYGCMNIEEIFNMKFAIDEISHKDCALFIWVVFPLLTEGIETIKRWGFEYKTVGFVWVKTDGGLNPDHRGIGHWTMCNSEICLIGKKGNISRINNNVEQIIMQRRLKHSQKPAETRKRIVELMGNLPRIELFSRKEELLFDSDAFEGWDVWGNEVKSEIKLW